MGARSTRTTSSTPKTAKPRSPTCSRPVAAARLPLHVRPRLGRRLPELLVDRRRVRRDASPPPEPRRRVHRGVPCAARRSCSPTGSGWAGASRGCRRDAATSTTTSTSRSTRRSRRSSTTTGDQAELERANVAWRDWSGEQPGMSAFALDDGVVYHTYSAYSRGFDALWTDVAMARPGAARPQRGRPVVVPAPRRVRGQLPMTMARYLVCTTGTRPRPGRAPLCRPGRRGVDGASGCGASRPFRRRI